MRMLHGSRFALVGILMLPALVTRTLTAQQGGPHIGYAWPSGGQLGTSVQIRLGGQFLKGARQVIVSGRGVEARVLGYCKPPNRGQANKIRQKLREMWKEEQAKRRAEGKAGPRKRGRAQRSYPISQLDPGAWKRLATSVRLTDCSLEEFIAWQRRSRDPKRQPNAQLDETVRLQLDISPQAQTGKREIRLLTQRGLTNPIRIEIGSLMEHLEQEPNDRQPDAGIADKLPVLINGQILPGEVDRFSFDAKKGRRIVAIVSARQLIPYLADTVPGWFQATLSVLDDSGRRLAYVDDYKFHPDPVLSFVVPADGRYTIEIKDAIHRGREDFVYRLRIGEIPFATSAWPLGVRLRTKTRVRLEGWNLPDHSVNVHVDEGPARIASIASIRGKRASNALPLALGVHPESMESEPNDDLASAQSCAIPILVNGRIKHPEDRDLFGFDAEKGGTYCLEILARRLGSPLDARLQLLDANGKVCADNDDHRDEESGLMTHHADPRILWTAPADGRYTVRVVDTQHKGSSEHAYRLRMTTAQPDFALRVMPASLNLRAGTSTPLTVHAIRKDGFDAEIELSLAGAPRGFRLEGATIPAGVDRVRLTIATPSRITRQPLRLQIEGRARVDGKTLTHVAQPAEDRMQAFLWRHLVASEELWAIVQGRGRAGGQTGVRRLEEAPAQLARGAGTWIAFAGPPQLPWKRIRLALDDPPAGLSVGKVVPGEQGRFRVEILAEKNVPLDLRGNLILRAWLENPAREGKSKNRAARSRRSPLGHLPAIPFRTRKRSLSF